MVMKSGPDKHLVLLLNKIDLVPREAVEKWLKYLREELPIVAFKCSTQQQRSNLGWKSSKKVKPSNTLQLRDCLGTDTLLKLLKNYSRSYEDGYINYIWGYWLFFCTNSINIHVGLNGLEVGQIVVIASAIVIHNIMQIGASKDPEYKQAHAFSVYLTQPLLATSGFTFLQLVSFFSFCW